MSNNLEEKNSVDFHNWGIYGYFETPWFSMKFLNCSNLIIFASILVIFFCKHKICINSLYLLPASFGCRLRAAERQPATLRLLKQLKCSKMINLKDKIDFLVQVTFVFNLEPFLFHVRGDMRARPRYADADSANSRAISADR